MMNTLQLVTRRLYFGVDAAWLHEAAGRVLSRVEGAPAEQATIALDMLAHDFRLNAPAGKALAEKMVESGLLEQPDPIRHEYVITERFRHYAQARIVEPLPRSRAQLILAHVSDLATHFNRTAYRNKYEIESVAVFGDYMSRDPELSALFLGVTVRRRAPGARHAVGRATEPLQGHAQIRNMLEELSSFVLVKFFQRTPDVPRPFSVVFKDDA
ncbi:MAG TPA: hypothetical protein VIK97_11620 [Casimicrobiaceae bacterium]